MPLGVPEKHRIPGPPGPTHQHGHVNKTLGDSSARSGLGGPACSTSASGLSSSLPGWPPPRQRPSVSSRSPGVTQDAPCHSPHPTPASPRASAQGLCPGSPTFCPTLLCLPPPVIPPLHQQDHMACQCKHTQNQTPKSALWGLLPPLPPGRPHTTALPRGLFCLEALPPISEAQQLSASLQ